MKSNVLLLKCNSGNKLLSKRTPQHWPNLPTPAVCSALHCRPPHHVTSQAGLSVLCQEAETPGRCGVSRCQHPCTHWCRDARIRFN